MKEERDDNNAPMTVYEINKCRAKKHALQGVLNNDDSATP